MTPVIWSPQAIRDLESVRAFIAQNSPAYADLEARRIIGAVERLQLFPESGRRVPERRNAMLREIILAPYRIVYRLRSSVAEVVTVFRASRRFVSRIHSIASLVRSALVPTEEKTMSSRARRFSPPALANTTRPSAPRSISVYSPMLK
ncbi:MAG: type II toxin-antitoxin system RelE/ParE family toxin [Solirubrobacterales bacterium]|nr:type II toxin-antitoxin system RelE/ParE family toxin [Solirubrobacterales bacterium]